MSLGSTAARRGRLSLSRVAEETFAQVGQNFVPIFLLSLAVMAVPALLNGQHAQNVRASGVTGAALFRQFGPLFWTATVLSLLCATLLYASLSWAAAERAQGRTPGFAAMLAAGLRALPVLVVVDILAYLGVVLGTVCLIVPGIFLGLAWSVVTPVVVVERVGVFRAFGRSFELTRNHRWAIFLAILVYGVGCTLLGLVVGVFLRLLLGATGNVLAPQTVGPMAWVATAIQLLLSAVLRTVGGTGLGVIYAELRGASGGFDARKLQDVFA